MAAIFCVRKSFSDGFSKTLEDDSLYLVDGSDIDNKLVFWLEDIINSFFCKKFAFYVVFFQLNFVLINI
ncbi:MAG TPA: hypothetical protein DCE71_03685 [Parachlamydiales bacterium]|nr:hypothetical protein [Parachlamydiales bacterium]